MSTYTDASLIVTPNGKKAGKLYSLKPTDGAGDLDVVRATTATYVDADGVIQTALANEPRLDYTNGSCPSILVEPQRTNLATYSEQFDNAAWVKNTVTITANATEAPDGTLTADKLVGSNSTSQKSVYRNYTASGVNTLSCYFKSAEFTTGCLKLGGSISANFDLSTGAITSELNCVASIQNVGGGWYRCSITTTLTTAYAWIAINTASTIGNGTDGIYIWGAQLEAGSNATSYIPTVASAVTRNADVISKSGISSLIGQTEGTIFVDLYSPFDETSKDISLSDGTLNNRISIGYLNIANRFTLQVIKAGVSQVSNTFIPINQDITNKIILSYSLNNYRLFINGVLVFTDNVAEVFTNELSIFQLNRGIAQNPYFGRINSIQLYKTALTDQQCIELTTL